MKGIYKNLILKFNYDTQELKKIQYKKKYEARKKFIEEVLSE